MESDGNPDGQGLAIVPGLSSAHLGRPFSFSVDKVDRARPYRLMTKPTPKPRSRGPRTEHPRLIGLTAKENRLIERAAEWYGVTPSAYMRDTALSAARKALGVGA